jgi:hypothetical protein
MTDRPCLQHCVSSLTEVNKGLVDGLRISASSLLISASISCSSSPESSSAAAPFVCSPYTLVTYYHPVRKWAPRDHYCHCQRFGKNRYQPLGTDPAGRRRSLLLSSWRTWPICRHHQVGSPESPLRLCAARPIAFCPIALVSI